MNLPSLTGIAVGASYGYIAQRGAFCMNSGFRLVITKRDTTKLKAYGLAIAIQLVFVPLLFTLGVPGPTFPSFFPLGAVLGGLLFGASMGWAAGCAAGVWFKAGAGSLSASVAIVGMGLAASLFEVGPLSALRVALQSVGAGANAFQLAASIGVPLWTLTLPVGALLLALLLRCKPGQAGAWSWRRSGTLIGLVGAAAWPLSGWGSRPFGMAVTPGTVALLTAATGRNLPLPVWDVLYVLAIPLGAYLAARREGPVELSAPAANELPKRFFGGLGLGSGASLAAGCTVGHGLTGIPLLAPGSLVATASIFAGSALAARWQLRRAKSGSS